MKISGFILTALALTYLYLWRTGNLGLVTPGGSLPVQTTTEHKMAKAVP